jgi:hypothetical protein
MEFTIRSGATGTLPAGMLPPEAAAEYARIAAQVKPGDIGYYRYVGPKGTAAPVTQQLPDFAGVPQSMTTKTDGTRTTKTYTYGTPPAERKSKKVASEPKAQASYGGVPACSLTMVGGTGYACASD